MPESNRKVQKGTIKLSLDKKVFKDSRLSMSVGSLTKKYSLHQMKNISGKYSKEKNAERYSCNLDDWHDAILLVLDDLKTNKK
jgi:hypothetical protein